MSGIKKRLFITTGSISLVNALTIIEQTKNEACFEDSLIVLSFFQSEEFIKTSKKIASLHNFKEILFFKKERELGHSVNFDNYDCLYSITAEKLYKKLNRHKNVYIFDEGPGSVNSDISKLKNLKGLHISNFLNRLSFIYSNKNTPLYPIDKEIFNKISSDIIKLFKEKETLATNKNALFIGHYIYRKLGEECAIDFYYKYIEYLINKGYTVYYKAHPRDNDTIVPILIQKYKDNPKFQCLNNSMPIEIYNYDFDIVTGAYSGSLVSIPHYRKIPAIHLDLKELYKTSVGIGFKQFFALYDTYIPKFSEMEDVIGQKKEIIWERYSSIINKKPLLKDNKELKEILMYKPNILVDCFFGFLGIFCFKNKLKMIGRKKFYSMIEKLFLN